MNKKLIPSTDEAWEERILGADEQFVKVVDNDSAAKIDEAAGLQLISIRMHKSTIEDLKLIASINKIGYQTLMKQVMQRFVDCEMKQMCRELISAKHKETAKSDELSAKDDTGLKPKTRQRRKVA